MSNRKDIKECVNRLYECSENLRKNYMVRLIAGIRREIKKDMANNSITEQYPEAVSAKWLDAELLCLVVEHDVLGVPRDPETAKEEL